jgi:DNA-binding response OmpR family regulator
VIVMTAPLMKAHEPHHDVRTKLPSRRSANRGTRISVLVVDGGPEADELLAAAEGQPLDVHVCADAAEALLQVGKLAPDVILLGPGEGRLDPIEFLSIVRADDPQQPVIVGADPGCSQFIGRASDAGASAVVPRPYRVRELLALLNSLAPAANQVDLRPLALDLGRLRVALVTRQEVLEAVWGNDAAVRSNTLNVHIMRLRRRLLQDEHGPEWIKVVRGLGYQFKVPPVTQELVQ